MTLPATRSNVLILGLGLMGASLAMALRRAGVNVTGWARKKDVLQRACSEGVIDAAVEDYRDAVAQSDMIVLCLPIPQIITFGKNIAPLTSPRTLVTDIGSVKAPICAELREAFLHAPGTFIGAHPMCGTEFSGFDSRVENLYCNAPTFITPEPDAAPDDVARLTAFWTQIGARVVAANVHEHDSAVAYASHLPHIVAMALSNTILKDDALNEHISPLILRLNACAGSFRDASRVASSSPQMWREIFEANRTRLHEAIAAFQRELDTACDQLEQGRFSELENTFAAAGSRRDHWLDFMRNLSQKSPAETEK